MFEPRAAHLPTIGMNNTIISWSKIIWCVENSKSDNYVRAVNFYRTILRYRIFVDSGMCTGLVARPRCICLEAFNWRIAQCEFYDAEKLVDRDSLSSKTVSRMEYIRIEM